ncbi:2-(3-amino-3-carboxypropyl)histidine synthase subunit [Candidatus Woesearchaeota archaeon]|nr:2-(3-amino-3-carboxypropyl)histidine synthase subunit [Candidatus Woesearchaeota archaeon]
METVFIEARWEGTPNLTKVKEYCTQNNIKKLAVFSSVQFVDLELFSKELEGIEVLITKAKRTHYKGQILGCDSYHDSFKEDIIGEADAVLYVGDGKFHYNALLLSMAYNKCDKELIVYDPTTDVLSTHSSSEVMHILKRIKGRILKLLTSNKVGILVSNKPGQCHRQMALKLKDKLETDGKKVFIFVDNTFDFKHCEDYNFIDIWINTACPRIGQDDDWGVPMLNVREALDPEKFLEMLD